MDVMTAGEPAITPSPDALLMDEKALVLFHARGIIARRRCNRPIERTAAQPSAFAGMTDVATINAPAPS